MNTMLSVLFSTTLLYACANGGALRGVEGVAGGPGVWTGTVGYSGSPGGWSGPAGYPGVAGSQGYAGGQGAWSGPASGTPGGWPATSGYAGGPLGYAGPTALPQVLPDGSIADVPEVAAARAAHLNALQAAYSDPRAADGDDGEYNVYKYGDNRYFQQDHHSSGTLGYNVLGSHARGLQEQAAWKQSAEAQRPFVLGNSYANAEASLDLLIAKNAAAAATPTRPSGELVRPYSGPLATPQVLPSGYIADTIEVNVARQNHLRALAETEAAAAQWQQKNAGWN